MNRDLLPFFLGLLVAGCAPVEVFNIDRPPEYVVTRRADFYAQGPAQTAPPHKVEKDTPVSVFKKDSGFAYVKLPDERKGYLEWDALRLAPPVASGVPFDPIMVDEIVEVPLPDFKVVPDELPKKMLKQ